MSDSLVASVNRARQEIGRLLEQVPAEQAQAMRVEIAARLGSPLLDAVYQWGESCLTQLRLLAMRAASDDRPEEGYEGLQDLRDHFLRGQPVIGAAIGCWFTGGPVEISSVVAPCTPVGLARLALRLCLVGADPLQGDESIPGDFSAMGWACGEIESLPAEEHFQRKWPITRRLILLCVPDLRLRRVQAELQVEYLKSRQSFHQAFFLPAPAKDLMQFFLDEAMAAIETRFPGWSNADDLQRIRKLDDLIAGLSRASPRYLSNHDSLSAVELTGDAANPLLPPSASASDIGSFIWKLYQPWPDGTDVNAG